MARAFGCGIIANEVGYPREETPLDLKGGRSSRMPDTHEYHLPPGLYEKLLAEADRDHLERRGDPRLYTIAGVDPEDAHGAVAQYLEHLLAKSLALFRGKEGAERQRRLIDRVIATLIEELGEEWAGRITQTERFLCRQQVRFELLT